MADDGAWQQLDDGAGGQYWCVMVVRCAAQYSTVQCSYLNRLLRFSQVPSEAVPMVACQRVRRGDIRDVNVYVVTK